jgi:hypothetical protein
MHRADEIIAADRAEQLVLGFVEQVCFEPARPSLRSIISKNSVGLIHCHACRGSQMAAASSPVNVPTTAIEAGHLGTWQGLVWHEILMAVAL